MKHPASVLRFYFITDDGPAVCPPLEQVRTALAAGATMVQYRDKHFGLDRYEEVAAIRRLCADRGVPFVINDHILLAKAVAADGVHLGQDDTPPVLARRILGADAVIGLSVSDLKELAASDLSGCDYLGTGPVFATGTKADASPVCHPQGLSQVVDRAPLPVVAIGGIDADNAGRCFDAGAAGVAVISAITRSTDPAAAAAALATACGLTAPLPSP